MNLLKLVVTFLDIAFILLMYFFQRGQMHKPTKIGFWAIIMLLFENVVLIWK